MWISQILSFIILFGNNQADFYYMKKILFFLGKEPLKSFISSSDDLEIIKGATTTFLLKILGLVFSYGFNIIFAQLYGARVMGIYALAITIAGIFSLVGQLGLQTSTVRFIAQYAGKKNWGTVDLLYQKILRLILPSTILFALLLYFTSHYIANNIFNKPELVVPFKIISLSLPFGGFFNLNTSALRGLKRIRDSFIFQLIVPVISFFILIFLTYLIIKN